MKKVSATVSYPIFVEVEVSATSTSDEIRELLLDRAFEIFQTTTIKPEIREWTVVDG